MRARMEEQANKGLSFASDLSAKRYDAPDETQEQTFPQMGSSSLRIWQKNGDHERCRGLKKPDMENKEVREEVFSRRLLWWPWSLWESCRLELEIVLLRKRPHGWRGTRPKSCGRACGPVASGEPKAMQEGAAQAAEHRNMASFPTSRRLTTWPRRPPAITIWQRQPARAQASWQR